MAGLHAAAGLKTNRACHQRGVQELSDGMPVAGEFAASLNLTKRVFDVLTASLLLLAFAPLLLLAAALVKASGDGPVIFRQARIGAQGADLHCAEIPHHGFCARRALRPGRARAIRG